MQPLSRHRLISNHSGAGRNPAQPLSRHRARSCRGDDWLHPRPSRIHSAAQQTQRHPNRRIWIPAFAGMTSGCSLDRHPRSVAAQAPTSVPTQATTHRRRPESSAAAQQAPPPDPSFRRRPEPSAAVRQAPPPIRHSGAGRNPAQPLSRHRLRIRHSGAGRNPMRPLSEHGRPATAHAQDLALPRISCAPRPAQGAPHTPPQHHTRWSQRNWSKPPMNTIQRVVDLAERHSVRALDRRHSHRCGQTQGRRRRARAAPGARKGHALWRCRQTVGLITDADIEQALAPVRLPYLSRGEAGWPKRWWRPTTLRTTGRSLRALRSQLVLRWFDSDTAQGPRHHQPGPTRRPLLANRQPRRGVLAAWRAHPGHRRRHARPAPAPAVWQVDNRAGLSAALSGRGTPDIIQRVPALRDLSVLPAGTVPPNPQSCSPAPALGNCCKRSARNTTSSSSIPRRQPVCRWADGGGAHRRRLMVAQRNTSRIGLLRSYADMLQQAGASVVGSVLTDR